MFNYWTEGGFVAWGQQPDPDTGRTPLQLFMDGRAQAAYDIKTFDLWTGIMAGGPTVRSARARKRKLTRTDYIEIGKWVNKQLKKYDVWIVLMPANQLGKPFVKGLEHNPDWRNVFFNNKQKLFVDARTVQGKKLLEGIFNGQTVYPDNFSRNLIIAYYLLSPGREKAAHKQGLDFAVKAFKLNPSRAPMLRIISAARYAELGPSIKKFCENYINDFTNNKNDWAEEHGYYQKVVVAWNASSYLQKIAEKQGNTKLAKSYAAKKREHTNERNQLLKRKRW